jgi:hypothetical protein
MVVARLGRARQDAHASLANEKGGTVAGSEGTGGGSNRAPAGSFLQGETLRICGETRQRQQKGPSGNKAKVSEKLSASDRRF